MKDGDLCAEEKGDGEFRLVTFSEGNRAAKMGFWIDETNKGNDIQNIYNDTWQAQYKPYAIVARPSK